MREVPLDDQREALQFAQELFAGRIDLLILLTGVGTRTLVQALAKRYPQPEIVQALSNVVLVARGPKPIIALKELGLKPTIAVPEPNTWRDILATLDAQRPVRGLRIAVQEYGSSNEQLLEGLRMRGAAVIRVPVYRWALPEDIGPLRHAIQTICDGKADVLLFTSAMQVDHVLQVANDMGLEAAFRRATQRCVVASVGPVCAEELTHFGLAVDLQPSHPHMASLVTEASRRSRAILTQKRAAKND
jgi:uroporphyrinogen-III synthase